MNIDIDIHSIDTKDFQKYKLVDIREPNECQEWPAETDQLDFIPLSKIQDKMKYFSPKESYLLFCAKGGRSHYLAEILQNQGINAVSVNNGIASVNAYLNKINND